MRHATSHTHTSDPEPLEVRAAAATACTMGLFVFPMAISVIVNWVGDIDSARYSDLVTVVCITVWMLCVASGAIGVRRCLAWKRRGRGGVTADVLGLFNAAPVALALFLVFLDWYSDSAY